MSFILNLLTGGSWDGDPCDASTLSDWIAANNDAIRSAAPTSAAAEDYLKSVRLGLADTVTPPSWLSSIFGSSGKRGDSVQFGNSNSQGGKDRRY